MAFQLQDDYLDVYGDTKVFGKAIGGDITSNKKTYMLINAFNRANDELVDLRGVHALGVYAVDHDSAARWLVDLGEEVKDRGLASGRFGRRQRCEQRLRRGDNHGRA